MQQLLLLLLMFAPYDENVERGAEVGIERLRGQHLERGRPKEADVAFLLLGEEPAGGDAGPEKDGGGRIRRDGWRDNLVEW